jgi:hypothetical protein
VVTAQQADSIGPPGVPPLAPSSAAAGAGASSAASVGGSSSSMSRAGSVGSTGGSMAHSYSGMCCPTEYCATQHEQGISVGYIADSRRQHQCFSNVPCRKLLAHVVGTSIFTSLCTVLLSVS